MLAWCSIVGALDRTRDYHACHRMVRSSVPLTVSPWLFYCFLFCSMSWFLSLLHPVLPPRPPPSSYATGTPGVCREGFGVYPGTKRPSWRGGV